MVARFLFCAIGGAFLCYGAIQRNEANRRYYGRINQLAENNLSPDELPFIDAGRDSDRLNANAAIVVGLLMLIGSVMG